MMLKPTKFTNPDTATLNISAKVLKYLAKDNCIRYDDLLRKITALYGNKVQDVFSSALNLLFLLGKVEYLLEIDSIKIINETK